MIQEITIRMTPEAAAAPHGIEEAVARKAGIGLGSINDIKLCRKSVDARKHPVMLDMMVRVASGNDTTASELTTPVKYSEVGESNPRAVIIGAGPAGLFAALECLKKGIKPVIIERGPDVDQRRIDLANISKSGRMNPESNYCFGEGGAGAYSDGKLYTRSKKRGSNREVLETLVQHGASEDILIEAHPHIGSDKLPHVIRNIRHTILDHGGEVHFNTKATRLIIKDGRAIGVSISAGDILGDGVILATGHSARDTFEMLADAEVGMEAKGLAIGVRLEHPQDLIDRMQYHSPKGRGKYLPAAEYSYVTQVEGRGVYSFCMCPGGVIVPAGSAPGESVVNGMSASARAGRFANSGMVVEVHPGDFPEYASHGAFEMIALQKDLEKRMNEAAGDTLKAPAQRMKDFTEKKISPTLNSTSYAPGLISADFNAILPSRISERLRKGFLEFGKKSKGFLTNDATLVGLESRTSSPLRVVRDPQTMESITTPGLYPSGEGAGYAGGIVSAAIDGIRSASALAKDIEGRK